MDRIRTLILGAAGRDFHNFNVVYRDDTRYDVVGFTAAQIPNIAGRRYPAALAGPLYPNGIPICPEEELPALIDRLEARQVVFSYSDVSYPYVMHRAAIANAAGADFVLLGPRATMLESPVPVVAVCAVRTGAGKSQTSRVIVRLLREHGLRVAVVRHPMPYGDLAAQRVQRFAELADLERHRCTIEEMEEYEPHLVSGSLVYAGVDYADILVAASGEADVILWDGGNNDLPFYRPALHVVVADPLRLGNELAYHPGEANLRMADVVVINKVDTADLAATEELRDHVRAANPRALVVDAASPVTADRPELVTGRTVLVVEDGPTLTHGEMRFGAGMVAARKLGAAEVVDPRPFAVGSIAATYAAYPAIGAVLPAMGYDPAQVRELEATIAKVPCDAVIVGTPIDLSRLLTIRQPIVRARYELQEIGRPNLGDVLTPFLQRLDAVARAGRASAV
ncbi:MAG: GTPase [Acidobacteria bacterium RIFCSPLOWO2_02_FULL_68_18]|nr:MAG: GTPase [Acidobacteria bacterium RIFCSPLOWO2_02_FULL_68_18]OFW48662.1 MAG: GTPase [Acidobacteria bacterium RIFCSPLOWO2_12_FULL_68_19]